MNFSLLFPENETFLPASKNTGENDQEEVGYQKNKSQAEVQNKLDSCQNEGSHRFFHLEVIRTLK